MPLVKQTVLIGTFLAISSASSCSASTPFTCWPANSTGSLFDFVTCSAKSYIPANYIPDQASYDARKAPVADVVALVDSLLAGGCENVTMPDALIGTLEVKRILDAEVGREFCVAAETSLDDNGKFQKGWGTFIVPINESLEAGLHLQAPHPIFDGNTDLLASDSFRNVKGFRSLFLATRHRNAFKSDNPCLPNLGYSITDPAHNSAEPLFAYASSIIKFENARTCPRQDSCGILQLHGKGEDTCSSDSAFVTAGTSVGSAYTRNPQWIANRLQKSLLASSASAGFDWSVTSPVTSSCILTATRNVVGKVLNGVDGTQVCSPNAVKSTSVTGRFAHIETAEAHNQRPEMKIFLEGALDMFLELKNKNLDQPQSMMMTLLVS
ncbi:hypothetical protein HDU97_003325 [Phlyctochytrium planicorne]|nr:hypothetical protein HDU97_003325 [Phlyctochytrium planicorne]